VTGSKAVLVLQPRDLRLLNELSHMRVVDREDAREVAGFYSRTRANTRLLSLVHAGLLVKKAAGTARGGHKYLYALSRRGAQLIDVPYRAPLWSPHTTLAWSPTIEHQLAIIRLYLAVKQPRVALRAQLVRWATFVQPISKTIRLIPDAYVELETRDGSRVLFLEVDRGTESLKVWQRKIAAYLTLATSGEFVRRFHQSTFRVAVIAPSVRRLQSIRACVVRQTDKLFWFASPGGHPRDWLWNRTWLRPRGDDLHFLI
jgi:hypothetical protein